MSYIPKWIYIVAAIFCFLAIADLPYGFYRLVRWLTCGVAIASAMQWHAKERVGWVWIMALIAILFNPLMPFYFPKNIWMIFDAAVGACFIASYWQLRPLIEEANNMTDMATWRKPCD